MQAPESAPKLPVSEEIERSVLGAILLRPTAFQEANAVLRLVDFSTPANRRIYERMKEVHDGGLQVDHVTLADNLMANGQMGSVGGLSYLASLTDGLPDLPSISSYLQRLKKYSVQRQVHESAGILSKGLLAKDADVQKTISGFSANLLDLQNQLQAGASFVRSPQDVLNNIGPEALFQPWVSSPGMATGFEKFDDKTGGFYKGEIGIIAGETGSGKTSYALNIILHMAKAGIGSLIFTGEMSEQVIIFRLAAIHSGLSFTRWRRGWMKPDEQKLFRLAISYVMTLPIYMDSTRPISVHDARMRLERMVRDGKVHIGWLDYIQLINQYESGDGRKFRDEREAFTYASKSFMASAKDLDIPFIYLSQFSRAKRGRDKANRRPQLSDLMGASLEHDARLVIAIYREELDRPNVEELKGLAEVLILKSTNSGRGKILTRFHGPTMTFTEEDPVAAEEE